ncbi:MAG: hypothetical protein PHX86_08770 [Caldisericia bacterium]|nr:hypothetical protein [Caldisericia bacterium]
MLKKIIQYFKLLLFFDMNATTYEELDIDDLITRKARGSVQLQLGQYMTQEEYNKEREHFLNYDYSHILSNFKG